MRESPSRAKRWTRVVLFSLGILISVSAWFIEKAPFFPAILGVVAPDYVAVHDAFQILDQGEKAVLPLNHPGSDILLRWWDPQPTEEIKGRLSGIGRSTGVFNIITGVHHYELGLLTQDNAFMLKDFIWEDTQAKRRMQETLDKRLVRWSFGIFLFGLLLAISMFVWERRAKSPQHSTEAGDGITRC